MSLRVAHIGLGPIGCAVIQQIADRPGIETVAAIDLDPNKVGKSLDTIVTGHDALKSVTVRSDLTATLLELKPDVAVLCTSSSLPRVWPQIEEILRAGVPIVSTTEELSFPSGPNEPLTAKIDALAKECGVGVVGTGINPGFAMDALPVTLTAACERVEKIHIDRIQDASSRRLPFQQKIGAGLTLEEWQEKADAGTIRHVGLRESIAMIAHALNWELDNITDEISPQIATTSVSSPFMTVEPGLVCGMKQDGIGYVGGQPLIELHMEAYLGAPSSYEEIVIEGSPAFTMRIEGGLPGDIATAAIVVNTLPKVVAAPAGLHTMLSLPLPSFYRGTAA
jgi:4-hydroxy-tetrahydrodipicolinate reductase